MLEILSLSQYTFIILVFGLPVLAILLGAYRKARLLAAAYFCLFAVMIIWMTTLYDLLETGRYPNSTGMEGIGLFIVPAIYLASLVLSALVYVVAAWIARRWRGG
ncbi:MAG: hypothetical protein AAGA19_14915 [Pseudomonadota bacterium]